MFFINFDILNTEITLTDDQCGDCGWYEEMTRVIQENTTLEFFFLSAQTEFRLFIRLKPPKICRILSFFKHFQS
jgi:hypothetical protein